MEGFVLNGSTLAAIGALLGALSGAITFLFKALMASKDAEIAAIMEINKRLVLERDARASERDYFRDALLKTLNERPKRWDDPDAPQASERRG